jgi:hypothetical protein
MYAYHNIRVIWGRVTGVQVMTSQIPSHGHIAARDFLSSHFHTQKLMKVLI